MSNLLPLAPVIPKQRSRYLFYSLGVVQDCVYEQFYMVFHTTQVTRLHICKRITFREGSITRTLVGTFKCFDDNTYLFTFACAIMHLQTHS